jgi:hypothetical protein
MMLRNKTIRRIATIGILLLISILFSGCQLAREDGSVIGKSDKLCGVLVTLGRQDVQQKDIELDDADFKVGSNGVISFDEDSLPFGDNKVEGEVFDDGSASFDGISGYYVGINHIVNSDGEISTGMITDKVFHDAKLNIGSVKDNRSQNCEATISVRSGFHEIINLNPVFQREDETYYTLLGQIPGFLPYGDETGQSFSQSIDKSYTKTVDGEKSSENISFKVNVEFVEEAEQIFIKEMNEKDELIKVTEYFPNDPDKFLLDSSTSYVIVEELCKNNTDTFYKKRSIYSLVSDQSNKQSISHTCNFAFYDNIIGVKKIEFISQ